MKTLAQKLAKNKTRGKTKKSIRKMRSPEARDLARISLQLRGIIKRVNAIVNTLDLEYSITLADQKKARKDTMMKESTPVLAGLEMREHLDQTPLPGFEEERKDQ